MIIDLTYLHTMGGFLLTLSGVLGVVAAFMWGWLFPKLSEKFISKETFTKEVSDIHKQLKEIEDSGNRRGEEVNRRMSTMEKKSDQFPTKDDIHSLRLLLEEQRGEFKALSEKVDWIKSNTLRHDEYLRNQ